MGICGGYRLTGALGCMGTVVSPLLQIRCKCVVYIAEAISSNYQPVDTV